MKLLIFIFGLGYLVITNSFAQGFYGAYQGSLVTDKNLLLIEEQDGYFHIKLFLSEKESIQVIGQISNQKLTFPLPQNEGDDLAVCAELSEDSNLLTLAFELEGKNYSTLFERITSPKRDLVKTFFDEANTDSLDPRIIGNWVCYLSKDSTGKAETDKNHFTKSKAKTGNNSELAFVKLRYKPFEDSVSIEEQFSLPKAQKPEEDSFLTTLIAFGLELRNSAFKGRINTNYLTEIISNLNESKTDDNELKQLIEKYTKHVTLH